MSVNNLSTEQCYQLIADLHDMATGETSVTPTDLSSFISVAQSTLAAGVDPVLNALSQVVSDTIYAVRPYSRKFKGLEVTAEKWGGILRKVSYADREALPDQSTLLVDGSSIDQYAVRKPKVLETHYVGEDTWSGKYTIFTDQLITAFSNPAEFGSFMSNLILHFSNEREQWLENMSRAALTNFMGAQNILGNEHVVHALTEYNTLTGLTLTSTTVRQPDNFPAFIRWLYSRINTVSDKFTERSALYQQGITNMPIYRHTPKEDQRVYISGDFMNEIEAEVKSITYNNSFLNLADVESVGFWQAIDSPLDIQVTPVYVDSSALVTVGAAQSMSDVIGVIFDRDAVAYNVKINTIETTPYNAEGRYYNMIAHNTITFMNDVTEKGCIFVLD